MMVLGLTGLLVAVFVEQLPPGLNVWVISCSVGCLGLSVWATITYVAALAAKIPGPGPVRQVHIVGWGLALCLAGLYFMITASEEVWETIGVSTAAALLLFNVWAIPLLIWYHRRFRAAEAIAEQWEHAEHR